MEELNAGKGAEGAELTWCAGEVVSHKEPICREDPRGFQHGGGLRAWRQEELGLGLCISVSPRCISQPWHNFHCAWFSIALSPVLLAVGTHHLEPEEPLVLDAQVFCSVHFFQLLVFFNGELPFLVASALLELLQLPQGHRFLPSLPAEEAQQKCTVNCRVPAISHEKTGQAVHLLHGFPALPWFAEE